jgi:hypothetical protein
VERLRGVADGFSKLPSALSTWEISHTARPGGIGPRWTELLMCSLAWSRAKRGDASCRSGDTLLRD